MLACLYGWLPASLAVVGVLELAGMSGDQRTWGLLTFVLIPVGVALGLTNVLLRHRWIRSRESRSDVAWFVGVVALVLAVLAVPVGITGMIEGLWWLVGLTALLLVGCAMVARHEVPWMISPPSDGTQDHSSSINMMSDLTSGLD